MKKKKTRKERKKTKNKRREKKKKQRPKNEKIRINRQKKKQKTLHKEEKININEEKRKSVIRTVQSPSHKKKTFYKNEIRFKIPTLCENCRMITVEAERNFSSLRGVFFAFFSFPRGSVHNLFRIWHGFSGFES